MRNPESNGPSPSGSELHHSNAFRDASRENIPQHEIDAVMAKLLRKRAYPPDELLCAYATKEDTRRVNERALREAQLRAAIADALEVDTPANVEAIGRVVLVLLRLAMSEAVRDVIVRREKP